MYISKRIDFKGYLDLQIYRLARSVYWDPLKSSLFFFFWCFRAPRPIMQPDPLSGRGAAGAGLGNGILASRMQKPGRQSRARSSAPPKLFTAARPAHKARRSAFRHSKVFGAPRFGAPVNAPSCAERGAPAAECVERGARPPGTPIPRHLLAPASTRARGRPRHRVFSHLAFYP